jgi:hypothetical protein
MVLPDVFGLRFNGYASSMVYGSDGDSCAASFTALANVASATCQFTPGTGYYRYVIRFDAFSALAENNLHTHDGNPPLSEFACTSSTVTCTFTDVNLGLTPSGVMTSGVAQDLVVQITSAVLDPNTFAWKVPGGTLSAPIAIDTSVAQALATTGVSVRFTAAWGHTLGAQWVVHATATAATTQSAPTQREFDICSRRGLCDFASAECHCFDGYTGEACDTLSHVVVISNTFPSSIVTAEGPTYVGSALLVSSERSKSAAFNFLSAAANDVSLFAIGGDGSILGAAATFSANVVVAGQATFSGGVTVLGGGLLVQKGGMSVDAGALFVESDSVKVAASGITSVMTVRNTDPALSGAVISVTGDAADTTAFRLLDARASPGLPSLFSVLGTGRVNVNAGGLAVNTGGATVRGGLRVVDTGLTVLDAGIVSTIAGTTGSAVIGTAASAAFTGNVLSASAVSSPLKTVYNLLSLQNVNGAVFTVDGNGRTTVEQGGMIVKGSGLEIEAGGLNIHGGGMTISSGGFAFDSGGGINVLHDGLDILDGGAKVTSSAAALPVISVDALSPSFRDSAVVLQATNQPSGTAFNFLTANAFGSPILRIRGDGTVFVGGKVALAPSGEVDATGEPLDLIGSDGVKIKATTNDVSVEATLGNVIVDGQNSVDIFTSNRVAGEGASGGVAVHTGTAATSDSGRVDVFTGTAAGLSAGSIVVSVGASGLGAGGSVSLIGGSASGSHGGDVLLQGGLSSLATGGGIDVSSGSGVLQSSGAVSIVTAAMAAGGDTGAARLLTGGAASGNSGFLRVVTGDATSGAAGAISVVVGVGSSGGGSPLLLSAGAATTLAGGSVMLASGQSVSAGSGSVRVSSASAVSAGLSGQVVVSTGSSAAGNTGAP